jgi:uncharacterized protein
VVTGRDVPGPKHDELAVVDNPDGRRFEARLGDRVVGYAEYRPARDRLILVHTEVDPSMEGRGVGSRLATGVFSEIRARGLRATVQCPFMTNWLERHPEHADLVAGGTR